MTAISNLLPIESYAGYRIISSSALLLGLGDGWINMLKKISGKEKALMALFGKCMKELKGNCDPQTLRTILIEEINKA